MANCEHEDNKRKEPSNQNTGGLWIQYDPGLDWVLSYWRDGKLETLALEARHPQAGWSRSPRKGMATWRPSAHGGVRTMKTSRVSFSFSCICV